jgi:hypothetical protein
MIPCVTNLAMQPHDPFYELSIVNLLNLAKLNAAAKPQSSR